MRIVPGGPRGRARATVSGTALHHESYPLSHRWLAPALAIRSCAALRHPCRASSPAPGVAGPSATTET